MFFAFQHLLPVPGQFGPDNNTAMNQALCCVYTCTLPTKLHFRFSAGWEHAICIYNGTQKIAESGNYGRSARDEGVEIPAGTTITISSWHKRTSPNAHQPWWQTGRMGAAGSEIYWSDQGLDPRNAVCVLAPYDPKVKMVNDARVALNMDTTKTNVAVVGSTGAGKSSLINRLRGIHNNANGAARVGEVETTASSIPYTSVSHPNIVLWDVPGGGTQRHPAATYFDDKKLYAFNRLIVVFSTRFREIDWNIIIIARQWNIPVFVVRTKSDADLESKMFNNGMTMEAAIQELRTESNAIVREHVYIVSARAMMAPGNYRQIDETDLRNAVFN
jgi:GTP-binding protein EngB required for normal cell division